MMINSLFLISFLFGIVSGYIIVSKNSKSPVFIAGDLSGTGRAIIKQITAQGIPVKALIKSGSTNPLEGIPLVTAIAGESNDEEAVQSCMNGCIAAVSLVSGKTDGDGTPKLDYAGNSNIVEQAGILGVERIVFVSRYLSYNYYKDILDATCLFIYLLHTYVYIV